LPRYDEYFAPVTPTVKANRTRVNRAFVPTKVRAMSVSAGIPRPGNKL